MNKSIKWLEEEEGEVEDILLSPVEECLDVDAFGVSIIAGMTQYALWSSLGRAMGFCTLSCQIRWCVWWTMSLFRYSTTEGQETPSTLRAWMHL